MNLRLNRRAVAAAILAGIFATMITVGCIACLPGCASTATTGSTATTLPSLTAITAEAETATRAAVDAINLAGTIEIDGKYVITNDEWVNKIRPVITKIDAAEMAMEAAAGKNDQLTWQQAYAAVQSLTQQIQPYIDAANAAKAAAKSKATTKASS